MKNDIYVGLVKTTLADYPEKIACVVFFPLCNFLCPYCHNPLLIKRPESLAEVEEQAYISLSELDEFLKKRKNVLDGIVLSGGEALLNPHLKEVVKKAKDLGYSVKLDTNGSSPDLLNCIDYNYIALDIKTSFHNYMRVCNTESMGNFVKQSAEKIRASTVPYEFRITCVPGIFTKEDAYSLQEFFTSQDTIILQKFNNTQTLNSEYSNVLPYSEKEMQEILHIIQEVNPRARIRNA